LVLPKFLYLSGILNVKRCKTIEKEWVNYSINIDSKMVELRKLSINDNSKNNKLAMRVLEILDIIFL
jgi:hypothetical protein